MTEQESIRMGANWKAVEWLARLNDAGLLGVRHKHMVREAVAIGTRCGEVSAAESYMNTPDWKTQFADLFDGHFTFEDLADLCVLEGDPKQWAIGFIEGLQAWHIITGQIKAQKRALVKQVA